MGYTNPGWTNDTEPYINADNLNDISDTLECVPVENGGTGATTAADARANLGLNTTGINRLVAGFTLPIFCGGTGGISASAARENLGLGTMATINSSANFYNSYLLKVIDGDNFMDYVSATSGDSIVLADIDFSCHIYFDGSEGVTFTDLPSGFTSTNFHLLTLCSPDTPVSRKIQLLFPETGLGIYMRKRHGSLGNWGLITFTTV